MSAHHVRGDHCSVPGTCPRQTAVTAQVFSVGRGFLQARSDLGTHCSGLGMVDLVWRGRLGRPGPSYLGMHSLTPPSLSLSHGLTGLPVPGRRKETLETQTQVLWMRTLS